MSTIERLAIQGIRSFGCKSEDVQSMDFTSPLTLILGENGCGKTTIIECLKYALTGEAPPGSDRGKNFIHDPKIYNLSESLGQIKLEVRNINNDSLTICRSMRLTTKRNKLAFETLDSTITYMNKNKESKDSISQRCLDVDSAMISFMGVSKSIINNVLLCHQEDSSWPLDEPKKLKEKFDAIFGITEYNKAIENFIKMRKEAQAELKFKESDIRHLDYLKREMENKTCDYQKIELKHKNIEDDVMECDKKIKPIDERLNEIREVEYEVGKFQSLKVELQTKQNNCTEQIKKLNEKIKKPFNGTLDELNQAIDTFNEEAEQKKREYNNAEKKLKNLSNKKTDLQKKLSEFNIRSSNLIQQRQNEQECNGDRADKIQILCNKLNIPSTDDYEQSTENVKAILNILKDALINEERSIKKKSDEHDKDDQKRQTEIDNIRIELIKLEESITAMKKDKLFYEDELLKTNEKLTEINASKIKLNKVIDNITKMKEQFDQTDSKFDANQMRIQISDGRKKTKKLEEQFHKADEKLTNLTTISKQLAEITLKQKELDKHEQDIRRFRNKHNDNFIKVFENESIEQNYRRHIQTAYEKYRRQVKDLNDKLNKLILDEQSYEIKRKNLKDDIGKFEKDLEESNEKIFEKCHSTPYDELLTKIKGNVSKLQLEHGALLSAETMYSKYMKKIEEDPCCPLCHKNMTSDEATDLNTELSDEIHHLPDNIKRTERQLKSEQTKYETILQLKPIIEKIKRLNIDIPKRKEELQEIQLKLTECAENKESIQNLTIEPTEKRDLANTMVGDMSLLDGAIKEATRLKADIDRLKNRLPAGQDTSVSIEDLQLEKVTVSAELDTERAAIAKLEKTYDANMDSLNKARDVLTKLGDEKIKLEECIKTLPQLKDDKIKHEESLSQTKLNITKSQHSIDPLKIKLSTKTTEKNEKKNSNRDIIRELQDNFNASKNIEYDIIRLNKEMLDYQRLNLETEIDNLKIIIDKNKLLSNETNEEYDNTNTILEELKIYCLNQETLKRDLIDNRELKNLQNINDELDEENKVLSKKLGNLNFNNVNKEKKMLIQKRDDASISKGELLGKLGEIKNQLKQLKEKIDEPELKNSIHNHRKAFYAIEVKKLIISDLGQYRLALEWSLIQFHKEKMERINSLIREYWRLIYRGNDIDYIEIKTDTDKETSADRRRSYNYRVIQSKNNVEIEMRGRCSAGQRVLASLIIRMALAETFSTNCGVLALDEPTTNLDRNNIASLCDALNRIVTERETQSNFMLLIITHDEEFMSALGRINYYHRVSRNLDCKSIIRKHYLN